MKIEHIEKNLTTFVENTKETYKTFFGEYQNSKVDQASIEKIARDVVKQIVDSRFSEQQIRDIVNEDLKKFGIETEELVCACTNIYVCFYLFI